MILTLTLIVILIWPQRQRRLVEINTVEQCLNIFKTGAVQRRRVETKKEIFEGGDECAFTEPRVHAMVYEPTTGELSSIDVDFNKYLTELKDVYDLYNHEGDVTERSSQKVNQPQPQPQPEPQLQP